MNKLANAFKGSGFSRESGATSQEKAPELRSSKAQEESANIEPSESEMVPGVRGEMLPANQLVSMAFKVTAKERYLWNLALTKSGQTTQGVLSQAMRELIDRD